MGDELQVSPYGDDSFYAGSAGETPKAPITTQCPPQAHRLKPTAHSPQPIATAQMSHQIKHTSSLFPPIPRTKKAADEMSAAFHHAISYSFGRFALASIKLCRFFFNVSSISSMLDSTYFKTSLAYVTDLDCRSSAD